jgi:hypothetical protein
MIASPATWPAGHFHFVTPANPNPVDPTAEPTHGGRVLFSSRGQIFDTADLKPFETGDPEMPVIFLDVDSSRTFLQKRDRWKMDIDEVDADGIRDLAARLDLRPLVAELIAIAQRQVRKCAEGDLPAGAVQKSA